MQRRLQQQGPFLMMVGVMATVLFARFGKLIACPSCYLFADGSDGLKNYFTSAWFVRYDQGLWFNGMNHPYGEHVVYTDNQPFWSVLIKAIDFIIPMESHVIGTTNILLVAGLLICAIVMYRIFRELHLPRWYSALAAIPVTLLCPQIERFNGHYSLAYTFYLPLLMLLLIRLIKKPKSTVRSIALFLAIIAMGFTHLYYLFIGSVFLVVYALTRLVAGNLCIDRTTIKAFVIAVLAGIVVYGTIMLTDPVDDRPEEVYGMYVYTAKAEGTFLPWYEPFTSLWNSMNIGKPDVEGLAYVGLVCTLLFIPVLVWSIRYLVRRRKRLSPRKFYHASFWMISGTLIWLIATGWIYQVGAGLLLEVFPVLGQFRSLGRLAWMFYFALSVTVIYWSYVMIRYCRDRRLVIAICILCGCIWFGEGLGHLWQTTTGVFRPNNIFHGSTPYADLLSVKGFAAEDFQAILQFPTTLIGPEKLMIDDGSWFLKNSMQCAWETGIPMITSVMSRTSVSQAMDFIELTSARTQLKQRLELMDDRPILLLTARSDLKPHEQRIEEQAEFIGAVQDVNIYRLDVSTLQHLAPPARPEARVVIHKDFDSYNASRVYRGEGAFVNTNRDTVLVTYRDTSGQGGTFRLTCRAYLAYDTPGVPVIQHQILSPEGNIIHSQQHSQFTYPMSEADGAWLELAIPFTSPGGNVIHRFILETEDAILDEMFLERLGNH